MTKQKFFWTINSIYLCIWTLLAFNVVDRDAWMLENALVVVTVGLAAYLYQKRDLTKASYLIIFVFLCFHAIGAHYTYAKVPIGFTVSEWFGWERNHYDRWIHFLFGLLWFFPLRDIFHNRTTLPPAYKSIFTVFVVISLSSIFELIEWAAAVLTAPELGNAYLGSQGDEWDAHKDHALASLGCLISWGIYYIRYRNRS